MLAVTLPELQRLLGGVVRIAPDGPQWLDTRIGALRAAVIRVGQRRFDLAVATPYAHELDPMFEHAAEWRLIGGIALAPLPDGYIFMGCRGGFLRAQATIDPSFEQIVRTLWALAEWARLPWRGTHGDEPAEAPPPEPNRRRRRLASAMLVGVAVMIVIAVVRRRI